MLHRNKPPTVGDGKIGESGNREGIVERCGRDREKWAIMRLLHWHKTLAYVLDLYSFLIFIKNTIIPNYNNNPFFHNLLYPQQ